MSAATANWRQAWRAVNTRQANAFLTLSLVDGTVLYFSTNAEAFSGIYFEPLLGKDGAISASSGFMSSDVQLATMSFSIRDEPTGYAGGRVFSAMLAEHDFVGAGVSLVIAPRGGVDMFNDGLQRFVGVVQSLAVVMGEVKFKAKQGRDWNRIVQPRTVTRAENPQALEATVGSVIPVALGKLAGQPMRPPIANPYGDEYRIRELITGGLRAGQAVVIDAGRGVSGATRAKVAVASHAVKQLGSFTPNWGTSPFLEQSDGKLHSVDPLLADIFNDATNGAGFYFPDGTAVVFAPVYPVDLEVVTNYAENARAVLDPSNEFTAARFDYAGAKRFLYARLPNLENYGKFTGAIVYAIYRGGPSLSLLKMYLNNTRKGVAQGGFTLVPTANFGTSFVNINITPADLVVPTNAWEWGDCRIDIYFDGVGAGIADVIACGVAVQYVPKREVLETRKVVVPLQTALAGRDPRTGKPRGVGATVADDRPVTQNVTEVRGKFFANVHGQADTPTGTFTDTPNAVIERPPDIARYILETWGGVPDYAIVTGPGEFGSFKDARAVLKTRRGTDSVLGMMLSEEVDINTAIAWVADACAAQPILSEFTNAWEFHPWRVDPPLTYALPVSRADLLDPDDGVTVEMTPDTEVLSALRIAYGWDARSRSYMHETAIGATKSVGGHFYRNLRDASCKVVLNVNDKIDWTGASSGAHTYTIAAGDHTPTQLLANLHTAFSAVTRSCGLGAIIAANVNDRLYFDDDGVTLKTLTLDPADYGTMEALAAHVKSKLNSLSTLWDVTYNATTRKFRFGRTSGQGTFRFGGNTTRTCATTLGLAVGVDFQPANPGVQQFLDAPFEAEVGHVSIALLEEFTLNWKSGPNGLDGTKQSAWEVLGFDWVADQQGIGLGVKRHMGWCPKSDLEKLLANADATFGQRRAVTRDLRAIYDTPTALALRDRLVTMRAKSRAVVSFSSEVLADMRRGDVFEFAADMDLLKPYPVPGSGGSWVGRKFRVLETLTRFGGSWHTEVVAIDVTD